MKEGQRLITFDVEKIREAGYDVTTPVIVANSGDYDSVEGCGTGMVKAMEPLVKVGARR